jgi:hypothetical protein
MSNLVRGFLVVFLVLSITSNVTAEELGLEKEEMQDLLIEKGFEEDFIMSSTTSVLEELIENDAKSVEVEVELVNIYHSLDGNAYEVTEENKNEINRIREKDKMKAFGSNNLQLNTYSTQCVCKVITDGDWSGHISLSYMGKNGSNHEYRIFAGWWWDRMPYAYWGSDKMAIAWQNHATGEGGSYTGYAFGITDSGEYQQRNLSGHREVRYGIEQPVPLGTWNNGQGGEIGYTVSIPDRYNGDRTSVVYTYLHPYSPFDITLNIGPVSITYNEFWGDEWSYRLNHTIGEVTW